jgi:outer membrane protein insertion porin family
MTSEVMATALAVAHPALSSPRMPCQIRALAALALATTAACTSPAARTTPAPSAAPAAAPVASHAPTADAERPAASHRIEFTGNQQISSEDLRAALTGQGSVFNASGAVVEDALERGLLMVAAYYWERGFALVKVGGWRVEPGLLSIPIDEGPVFVFGSINVQGDLLGPAEAHLAKLRLRPGARFSRYALAEDRKTLETYYQDQGYAHAKVQELTTVDRRHGIIQLTLDITRGKLARYEGITVTGNTRTAREPILRALDIAVGDPFSATGLAAAKQRVLSLGFKNVVVETVDGSSDELVQLRVAVSE